VVIIAVGIELGKIGLGVLSSRVVALTMAKEAS
jgi:hypothetical protein